jgi:ABC-type uncharacterized transport system involved in gliding motility auxiliary subunit
MDRNYRRFAPIGLYVSLAAALVSLGIYIVLREWNLALQISLGIVVLGLAFFILMDPDRTRRALTGRQAKYGSNALLLLIAFVGIIAVVNFLAYQNNHRWDLTEDKTNTLAPETLETLTKFTEPVTAIAFYTSRTDPNQAKSLLDQYAYNADGNFKFEFINPESDPITAQNANVTRDGTIVFTYKGRSESITYVDEQQVTAALVKLLSEGKKSVYFLTGHGEINPDDTGDQSYSQWRSSLQAKNFTVSTLNLVVTDSIPEDANVIVVADPKQPLLAAEVDLLGKFAVNGGGLVVLLEPTVITNYGDSPDLLAQYLSETWGITFGNDIIVDQIGQQVAQQPFMAVGADYANHAIISEDLQNLVTFFMHARSVSANTQLQNFSLTEVVRTSSNAWAETDLAAVVNGTSIAPDDGDINGSVPLVVASENTATNGRVLAVGDSDFAMNAFQTAYGNPDLAMNIIDWAAGQENLINLTPKTTTTRSLTLTPTIYTRGAFILVFVILLPGIALVAGIVVLVIRRRKG